MRALATVATVTLLWASAAQAGPLASLAATKVMSCQNGVVPTEDVIFALLNAAGVPQSSVVHAQFEGRQLGKYMNDNLRNGDEWPALRARTRSLIEDGPTLPEKGYAVSFVGPVPNDPATALMNRDAAWLRISCQAPPQVASSGGNHQSTGLIIARSLADADKPAKKRDFATLSYTRDYEADESIISTEIFVGLPSVESGLGPDNTFRPYVTYQRRTGGKPLNDLTFGGSSRWFVTGARVDHAFFLNGEFESDDKLKSEVYRAELIWEPVLHRDPCGALTGDKMGFSCTLRAALDTQSVEDAGNKTALQDLPSFTRFGGDFRFSSYWNIGSSGSLHFDATYGVREPFNGKDGDAAFGELSLKFVPDSTPKLSFGVEYFEGEDLTSLERSKTFKFAIGFRN